MSFTLYQASLPVFIHGLRNLANLLTKGEADATARGYAPDVLINARLAPDMFVLSRQVQIACDMVKNGAARLVGIDPPSFPDTETSFAELHTRIAKTIAFFESLTEAQFEGADTRAITLKFPQAEFHFTGADYLTRFVLPNFYFHMTTAYNILRHNGVGVGKSDFIGGS